MKSRYLAALEEKISMARADSVNIHLRAERAGYLARLGEVVASREEIALLRIENQKGVDARASILINMADGLLHYYENMGVESRGRFDRAYALAIATGNGDLASLSAAWLALFFYGAYDFSTMSLYLRRSQSTGSSNLVAKARNALTLAQTIHLANRFDLARGWYQRARLAASDIEDDAMISAIMYNMSSIWVANLRNHSVGGVETTDKQSVALLGVLSTMNFDGLVGSTSQPSLTPLVQAQLMSIEGKYQEALNIYSSHIERLNIDAVQGWQKWLLADQAWCLLQAGSTAEAKEGFDAVSAVLSDHDHVDDLAASFRRLSDGYRLLGEEEKSRRCRVRADDCWLAFQRLQGNMLNITSVFLPWLEES